MDDPDALKAGELRGRNLILAHLTRPGPRRWPGDTYLALDRASFEEVTLTTVPRSAFVDAAAAEESFLEELGVARRVFAEGFSTVLSGEARPEGFSLTTRWVMGIDLRALLAWGPPRFDGAIRILWEVGDTLSSLHGEGLVHGNLQPGNVVLEPDGRAVMVGYRPVPLIQLAEGAAADPRGPHYVAPEQRETGGVTSAGDVYSLGALTFELLTGESLGRLGAELAPEDVPARLETDPLLGRVCPPHLKEILQAMLSPDPGGRPHLASEVIPALLKSIPSWNATRPLRDLLELPFEQALSGACRAALTRADALLEDGNVLQASVHLYTASELASRPERELVGEIAEGIRACLWSSLSLEAEGEEEDRDVVHGEAMTALLFKTAFNLRLRKLITVCRHRLADFTHRRSPFAAILPVEDEREELARSRPVLVGWARGDPLNEDVLLGLAQVTEGFRPRPATTANRRKADLLRKNGLPAAALYYAALDLPHRTEDLLALERIRKLAAEAVEVMRGDSKGQVPVLEPGVPARPPGMDTPLPGDVLQDDTGPLATPVPGEERPQATRSDALRDAETLFSEGQALTSEGQLSEAARCFTELTELGVLEQEHYHAALCKEVHRLLWRTLASGADLPDRTGTIMALLDLIQKLELTPLLPVVERVAIECLEETGGSVRELLRRCPFSVPVLTAAADELADEEDERRYMRVLVDLGSRLMDVGEIGAAMVQLRRAESVDPQSKALVAVRERMERAREQKAEIEREFDLAQEDLVGATSPARALALWEGFLGKHAGFLQAVAAAADMAVQARNFPRAAHWNMRMARHHFLCSEDGAARERFRTALRAEPDNQEALLFLAAIEPPNVTADVSDRDVRITLLRREGLHDVAIHLARKELRGTPDDLAVHRLLVELCRESQADPTDHLLAQGFLALESGDEETARNCFEEAVRGSPEGDTLVDTLMHSPAIHQLFSPTELLRLRS